MLPLKTAIPHPLAAELEPSIEPVIKILFEHCWVLCGEPMGNLPELPDHLRSTCTAVSRAGGELRPRAWEAVCGSAASHLVIVGVALLRPPLHELPQLLRHGQGLEGRHKSPD